MPHIKVIVLFFLIFIGFHTGAQQIIFADVLTGAPIRGAEVESEGFGQMTNKDGMVDITKIPSNQKLFITHLSYEPKIVLKSTLNNNDTIFLKQTSNYLDSIIVTSPLRDKINVKDEPHQATEITKEDIDNEKPATSADLLQGSGQVLVQKSQGGGGSPMIRGFEANKLLMVIDGVRMNNAIYRSGHLQNAITVDPSILSGVEVIFGPSSVLYGSDALGGVMHFHTATPKLADSTKWVTNSNVSAFYNSNDNSLTSNFNYGVGQKKWGLLTSV